MRNETQQCLVALEELRHIDQAFFKHGKRGTHRINDCAAVAHGESHLWGRYHRFKVSLDARRHTAESLNARLSLCLLIGQLRIAKGVGHLRLGVELRLQLHVLVVH